MSKRLPMRKISEVLRLTKDGLTQREIAHSVGVSPTTVAEYTRLSNVSIPALMSIASVDSQASSTRIIGEIL